MKEKEFDVVVVLGSDAVREYSRAWDNNEQVSEEKLENLGCVTRRSFKTKEERDAYIMALSDADGWFENIVVEEQNLKP
jgi:hypothetical protein